MIRGLMLLMTLGRWFPVGAVIHRDGPRWRCYQRRGEGWINGNGDTLFDALKAFRRALDPRGLR